MYGIFLRDSCEKLHQTFSPVENFSDLFPIQPCKLLTPSPHFNANSTLMSYFRRILCARRVAQKTGDMRASNGRFLNSASHANASLAPDQGATGSGRISGFFIFLEEHHV
jgi:hypothetical protein